MVWLQAELENITAADDLKVSPFREDGATYGTPTWVWSVTVENALYVRAFNGTDSRWYRAAVRQRAGRISSGGMTREVTFDPVDGAINDRVDRAYRLKYRASLYFRSMTGSRARAATIKIMPRDTASLAARIGAPGDEPDL